MTIWHSIQLGAASSSNQLAEGPVEFSGGVGHLAPGPVPVLHAVRRLHALSAAGHEPGIHGRPPVAGAASGPRSRIGFSYMRTDLATLAAAGVDTPMLVATKWPTFYLEGLGVEPTVYEAATRSNDFVHRVAAETGWRYWEEVRRAP